MTIQDFPVSYEDLEPHFDHFEYVCGTSGKAGVINGQKIDGGNPFEGSRSREFPLPPNPNYLGGELFYKAAREMGYHPYPIPASNASGPYTNPYGCQMGPCNFCGFCSDYGCLNYSKASPNACILPVLRIRKNFELRTHAQVLKVDLDSTGKKATGVTYLDALGRETQQPAALVLLCAFSLYNVHLMLVSGIGTRMTPCPVKARSARTIPIKTSIASRCSSTNPYRLTNSSVSAGGRHDLRRSERQPAGRRKGRIRRRRRDLGPAAGRRSGARRSDCAGRSELGQRVEARGQGCLPPLVLLRGSGFLHVLSGQLSRSRSDL